MKLGGECDDKREFRYRHNKSVNENRYYQSYSTEKRRKKLVYLFFPLIHLFYFSLIFSLQSPKHIAIASDQTQTEEVDKNKQRRYHYFPLPPPLLLLLLAVLFSLALTQFSFLHTVVYPSPALRVLCLPFSKRQYNHTHHFPSRCSIVLLFSSF